MLFFGNLKYSSEISSNRLCENTSAFSPSKFIFTVIDRNSIIFKWNKFILSFLNYSYIFLQQLLKDLEVLDQMLEELVVVVVFLSNQLFAFQKRGVLVFLQ